MIYTEARTWEGNHDIKEILVFFSVNQQAEFERNMKDKTQKGTDAYLSTTTGKGALFKLKTIKNIDGKYIALIRCGHVGSMLHEESKLFDSSELGMQALKTALRNKMLSNT